MTFILDIIIFHHHQETLMKLKTGNETHSFRKSKQHRELYFHVCSTDGSITQIPEINSCHLYSDNEANKLTILCLNFACFILASVINSAVQ
jgi:hypothetical protein